MNKLFPVILIASALSGCAQQSFSVNRDSSIEPKEVITHHFFIHGLGQEKTVDAARICGGADKIVRTETQHTFMNGLMGFLTLGIYTPREARVYCVK